MDDIQIPLTQRLSKCPTKTIFRLVGFGKNTMKDGRVFYVASLADENENIYQYSAQVGHPDSMDAYNRFREAMLENQRRENRPRVWCKSWPRKDCPSFEVFQWEPVAPKPWSKPDYAILDLFGGK